ncbi:type II secretion system minor pseudopilin GspK [Sphingomonas sp. HMP6]|uniref:type II secretion system minor pseudopilin GspK n=1 Tax=Sphingomonas sp. HMP6 TaxID=1517551 RepID=UPI001596FE16|nr:type II secretion system minor pseudopilin GspK [Sphingomonas sp. HMP6]BCA58375.1 type II secretory pathway protein [Sphingomonas sp. HMP6]
MSKANDVAPSERGAALLTVLLLVAVIAVLAGTALEKLRLATRLGGNAVALDQARAYSFAAETLAVVKVTDLLLKAEDRVTLQGGWSGKPIPLPVPSGTASAVVVDGGNCFNLNSLVTETGPGVYASFTPARIQFARLIRLVDPAARAPDAIAAAASDWIDTDSDAIQDGAEDGAYAGGKQGYRTGNTLMRDPSELRAVAGVARVDYDTLRPWICALPIAAPSKINVNTILPEQAPLLAMLRPNLTVEAVRQGLLRRPPAGFSTAAAFWSQPIITGAGASDDAAGQSDIKTVWFSLQVDVAMNGAILQQTGLIDASVLPARLVSRQWGERT